jgi:hypothetical protein
MASYEHIRGMMQPHPLYRGETVRTSVQRIGVRRLPLGVDSSNTELRSAYARPHDALAVVVADGLYLNGQEPLSMSSLNGFYRQRAGQPDAQRPIAIP